MPAIDTPQSTPGFNVHTLADRKTLLTALGLSSIEDLFVNIPQSIRMNRPLNLPGPLSEWETRRFFQNAANKNRSNEQVISFLGGGAYQHHIPAVVDTICNRGEFLTAYTPYQPEMSQGLLQALFEYQSLISGLAGLPTVNSSLYDGATALAEGAWMACSIQKKKIIAASRTLLPQYQEVLTTYMTGRGVVIVWVDADPTSGQLDLKSLEKSLAQQPACFVIQTPNRSGMLEDISAVAQLTRRSGALLNAAWYPMLFPILQSPGSLGVDILSCEGQPLGIPLSLGGPYLGILATHKKYERFIPGRLVGRLTDLRGQNAFALIKEEREQHVSRDEATSHICSNQALQAIRAAVYLATVGDAGFKAVASQCATKARYLAQALTKIPGVTLRYSGTYFNEFVIRIPAPVSKVLPLMLERGFFAGIDVSEGESSSLLVAVTEVKSREDLDAFAKALAEVLTHV